MSGDVSRFVMLDKAILEDKASARAVFETAAFHYSIVTVPMSLEHMQKMVGGYVELIDSWNTASGKPVQVYGNEDGRRLDLWPNVEASIWLERHRPRWQNAARLVGTIVVLAGHKAVWK